MISLYTVYTEVSYPIITLPFKSSTRSFWYTFAAFPACFSKSSHPRRLRHFRAPDRPRLSSPLSSAVRLEVCTIRPFVLERTARRGGVSGEIAAAVLERKVYIFSTRDQKRRLKALGRGSERCRRMPSVGAGLSRNTFFFFFYYKQTVSKVARIQKDYKHNFLFSIKQGATSEKMKTWQIQ